MELLVNSTGGIQGHPLKIVTADTQTNGQVDVQLVNGLLAKHAQAFIDGAPSTACLASIPLVEKNGPVDYCLSPAVHPQPGGYVFTVNGSTLDLTTVDIRYFRERGWKRLAVLTSTDSSGQDYDRVIPTVLSLPQNHDMHVAVAQHFNNSDISVAAQIARIKNSDAPILDQYNLGHSRTRFGPYARHGAGALRGRVVDVSQRSFLNGASRRNGLRDARAACGRHPRTTGKSDPGSRLPVAP